MSDKPNRKRRNRKAAGLKTQAAQGETSKPNHSGNSAQAQRQRLKRYLQEHGYITTIQARHLLDVICPAARIFELRERGCNIETLLVTDVTPEGRRHRVAKYVWHGEQ